MGSPRPGPRLSLGQGLPELAQQRHLLAGALPAGRGPPSAQGAQRVSHSGLGPRLPQLSGPKMSGARNVPKRRPRPFQSPPVPLILPCRPRTSTEGVPWANPGPAPGKSRINVPNFRESGLGRVLFCFVFLNFLFGKISSLQESCKNYTKIPHIPLTQLLKYTIYQNTIYHHQLLKFCPLCFPSHSLSVCVCIFSPPELRVATVMLICS